MNINSLFISIVLLAESCHNTQYKREYYADGTLKSKVSIQNGVPEGFGYDYYPSGELKRKTSYSQGLVNGSVEEFYRNGTVSYFGEYTGGKENGIYLLFDSLGNKTASSHFSNGLEEGTQILYFSNGQVESICDYSSDKFTGKMQKYFSNGQIAFEAIGKNDTTLYYKEFNDDNTLNDCYYGVEIIRDSCEIMGKNADIYVKIHGMDTTTCYSATISAGRKERKYSANEFQMVNNHLKLTVELPSTIRSEIMIEVWPKQDAQLITEKTFFLSVDRNGNLVAEYVSPINLN